MENCLGPVREHWNYWVQFWAQNYPTQDRTILVAELWDFRHGYTVQCIVYTTKYVMQIILPCPPPLPRARFPGTPTCSEPTNLVGGVCCDRENPKPQPQRPLLIKPWSIPYLKGRVESQLLKEKD